MIAPPARLLRVLRRRLAHEQGRGGLEVPERGGREVQATVTRPPDPPHDEGVEQR